MTLEFWGTAAEILRTLQWRGEGGGWQEQCEMMSINTFFFLLDLGSFVSEGQDV